MSSVFWFSIFFFFRIFKLRKCLIEQSKKRKNQNEQIINKSSFVFFASRLFVYNFYSKFCIFILKMRDSLVFAVYFLLFLALDILAFAIVFTLDYYLYSFSSDEVFTISHSWWILAAVKLGSVNKNTGFMSFNWNCPSISALRRVLFM